MIRFVGTGSVGLLCLIAILTAMGCQQNRSDEDTRPYINADSQVEAGRYLVTVAGCNDCHTHGYLLKEGDIPEDQWLTGSTIGWRGPWGTTYANNLRLRVQEMSADDFVEILHTRKKLPPMPWFNVVQMSEKDARAVYAYIKSLGPKGEHMPAPVPPGKEPETPYFSLFPQNMPEQPPAGGNP
ncbi:MAG: hypothetical protein R3211_01630 [Balneolaceae bacterium]|nr:hypothetical protein [Balneolaceae bacterium]